MADGAWTMARVAGAYDTLMRGLGYESYGIHGSDGGALVSRELAVLDPEGFLGAHVLHLFSFPSGAPGEMDGFGEKEYAALAHLQWFQSVGGYNTMNATRPQTVAAGSRTRRSPCSPTASCSRASATAPAWSVRSRCWRRRPCTGSRTPTPPPARYHYEEQHSGAEPVVSRGRIGVAVFKDDFQTIRALAERDNANIVHWSEFPRGGHFAALEVPEDLVADLRVFFRDV